MAICNGSAVQASHYSLCAPVHQRGTSDAAHSSTLSSQLANPWQIAHGLALKSFALFFQLLPVLALLKWSKVVSEDTLVKKQRVGA